MSITQKLIKILRWGFHCLTSMALNYLLRRFMMVLAVLGVSPIFGPYFSNSCPWQVSMGLSATV